MYIYIYVCVCVCVAYPLIVGHFLCTFGQLLAACKFLASKHNTHTQPPHSHTPIHTHTDTHAHVAHTMTNCRLPVNVYHYDCVASLPAAAAVVGNCDATSSAPSSLPSSSASTSTSAASVALARDWRTVWQTRALYF